MEKNSYVGVLIIVTVLLILGLLVNTNAEIQDELNDTSTTKTFGVPGDWSNLTYIRLPKTASVTSATLNLTGAEATTNDIVFTQYNLTSINDTFSDSANPDSTSHTSSSILTGKNAVNDEWRGFMQFNINISLIRDRITGANLTLNINNGPNPGTTAFIYNVTGDWLDSTLTHNNRPSRSSSIDSFSVSAFETGKKTFELTAGEIIGQIDNGRGFALDTSDGTGHSIHYDSEDEGTSDSPQLFIFHNDSVFPSNVTLDISNDGDLEFNHTGLFNTKNTTADFTAEVTSFLSTCTADSQGFCNMPLNISGVNGQVTMDAINVVFTEPPRINITEPVNGTIYTSTRTELNYTVFDFGIDSCWYSLDSGTTNVTVITNVTQDIETTWNSSAVNDWENDLGATENGESFVDENFSSYTLAKTDAPSFIQVDYIFESNIALSDIKLEVKYDLVDSTDGVFSIFCLNDSVYSEIFSDSTGTAPEQINISIDSTCVSGKSLSFKFNSTSGNDALRLYEEQLHYSNSCDGSITGLNSGEGDFTWTVYANDTDNNVSVNTTIFTVALQPPVITLDSPANNTFFNTNENIYLNYTCTDSNGIDTAQIWHDLNGTFSLNETNLGVTSGQQNFTIVNASSDGKHNWNIFCNDTTGEGQFNDTNFTFTTDTTLPAPTIGTIITTQGSQTFSFNATAFDVNLDSCWYSVFNSSGDIDSATVENTTCTFGSFNVDTVSDFATYNLTVYANDTVANENSTTTEFTLSQIPVLPGGGSGGSTTIINRIFAINFSIVTTSFGDRMDFVLAKGSVKPRERTFRLINEGIDPITVKLECDTTLLEINETTEAQSIINICDFVEFPEETITISPIEGVDTFGSVILSVPTNASFGDQYNFNILAIEDTEESAVQFDKLSVTSRVPMWGVILKWSFVPFQSEDLTDEEKTSYPVWIIALLIAFIVGVLIFITLRKGFPFAAFLLALLFFLGTFFSMLFIL